MAFFHLTLGASFDHLGRLMVDRRLGDKFSGIKWKGSFSKTGSTVLVAVLFVLLSNFCVKTYKLR